MLRGGRPAGHRFSVPEPESSGRVASGNGPALMRRSLTQRGQWEGLTCVLKMCRGRCRRCGLLLCAGVTVSTDPMQERTCVPSDTVRVTRWTRTPAAPYMTRMSQNVKRSPLSSYHLKHSTIVEHSDASTCPCASIARASQWSSQCSLTSGLSGIYGWTRHLRTPTQRERRSFTLSVQSNARTRLPTNVSVVFQGQISSSSDAIS